MSSPRTDAHGRVIVRVTVVEAEPGSAARVGDSLEVAGSELRLPPGGGFDFASLVSLAPLLWLAETETDPDSWMRRKPWFAGPDRHDGVVMYMDWDEEGEDRNVS